MAGNARQLPREKHRVAMRAQAHAEAARAAKLEPGYSREVGVHLVERVEGFHERGGGALPDARHTGNVVHLVAGERQVVREALRPHAEMPLDVVIAELPARAEIPEQVAVAHELREILVARDEGRA